MVRTETPNKSDIQHHYAGIIIITESGKFVGQRRDNKPTIDNPNLIGTFGGTVEESESPREAAWRELTQEETNLIIDIDTLQFLFEDISWCKLTDEWEVRHFYLVRINDKELNNMEVYEGQGWAYIEGPDDPDLIELWRPVIHKAYKLIAI